MPDPNDTVNETYDAFVRLHLHKWDNEGEMTSYDDLSGLPYTYPYGGMGFLQATASSYDLCVGGISRNRDTIDVGTQPNGSYGISVLGILKCFE